MQKSKHFIHPWLQIYLHNNIYFGCPYLFLTPQLIILHMVSYRLFTYIVGPKENNYIFTYINFILKTLSTNILTYGLGGQKSTNNNWHFKFQIFLK
jgi:hypothetical protein